MPLRKSRHYSSLWKSCDELRGGIDASQYKDTRLDQTVYDPACGSGSLLIKAADAAPNGLKSVSHYERVDFT